MVLLKRFCNSNDRKGIEEIGSFFYLVLNSMDTSYTSVEAMLFFNCI